MTTLAQAEAASPGPAARLRAGALVLVAVITPHGHVVIRGARVSYDRGGRGPRTFLPEPSETAVVGTVDPDDPANYRVAARLLRAADWRLVGDWTLERRWPAVQVQRAWPTLPTDSPNPDRALQVHLAAQVA